MPDLTPSLMTEITALAKQFVARFAQPEFIPGCKVLDVTDINLYAANNGWIEALCGQHNQQRVRWKSNDVIAVNDYVDVLYFADRRLFEAWGVGGSTGIPGPGGWPFAAVLTVSATDPDAAYSTIAAALAAAPLYSTVLVDTDTNTEVGLTIAQVLCLTSWDEVNTSLLGNFAANTYVLNIITAPSRVEQLTVGNIGSGTEAGCIKLDANDTVTLWRVIAQISGAATTHNAIKIIQGSNHIIEDCRISAAGSGTNYAINVTGAISATIIGGILNGATADLRVNSAGATITLLGPQLIGGGISIAAGTVKGYYYDANGNLIFVNGSGEISGVWQVDESATLKLKRATLATAITASASGDTIKLDTDTYSVSASQNIGTSITIEGDGPEATIYTTSVSNAPIFDITADNITVVFKDITLKHTGGGTAATGIFSNNSGVTVILDNAVLEISSGAGTDSRGLWIESGTWILRNGAKIVITSGTSKYGIYNDSAAATITIGPGCTVNGATQDIYGDQAGSTLTLNGAILTNNLISFSGTKTGEYFSGGNLYWLSSVDPTGHTHSKLVASDGSPDAVTTDADGYATAVQNPLFAAYNSASDLNVTGDGTVYTIICNTEQFDVGSNYNNSTGVFTAPVTGKYQFACTVTLEGILSTHTTGYASLVTSNRSYFPWQGNAYATATAGGVLSFSAVFVADMDASDTAHLEVGIFSGTKVVDVKGDTTHPYTALAGQRII